MVPSPNNIDLPITIKAAKESSIPRHLYKSHCKYIIIPVTIDSIFLISLLFSYKFPPTVDC